jgi:regulator of RNase E activity RraB
VGLLDRFRRPERTAREGDASVVEAMREAGIDLSRPALVEHFVYFSSEVAARNAAGAVRARGYDVEVREAPESVENPWLLFATHQVMLDANRARASRAELEAVAAEYGGDYDGWGSAGPAD